MSEIFKEHAKDKFLLLVVAVMVWGYFMVLWFLANAIMRGYGHEAFKIF